MAMVKKVLLVFIPFALVVYLFSRMSKVSSEAREFVAQFESRIEQINTQKRVDVQHSVKAGLSQKSDPSWSPETIENSEYNKVLAAVERINKNSENIEAVWKSYRIDLYKQMGVGPDLGELDAILAQYVALIRELQIQGSRYELESADHKVFFELEQRVFSEMDQDVRLFLGNERFNYLKKARANFNKAYQVHSGASIEILDW